MRTFILEIQIVVYNFCGSAADIVHFLHPLHLIFRFERFGYALTLCHLLYELRKHFVCLLVDVGKVSVHLAACQQIEIKDLAILLDIPQMPLTPNADRLLFSFGQF